MKTTINVEQLYARIANNNVEANEFIVAWGNHAHQVDDLIDNKTTNEDKIIQAFLSLYELLEIPFYRNNKERLYPIMFLAANAYCDSIHFNSTIGHSKIESNVANVLRSYGNEVLIMVAVLSGNSWEQVREISKDLRKLSIQTHFTVEGEPC